MFHIPTPAEQHHRQDVYRDALPAYAGVDEVAIRADLRLMFAHTIKYAPRRLDRIAEHIIEGLRDLRRRHTASIRRERGLS